MNLLLLLLAVCTAIGVRSHSSARPLPYRLLFVLSFLCAISFYSLRAT